VPIRHGSSRATIDANIRELMHSWEAKGHIGTGPPKGRAAADKQAVAIALSEARRSRVGKGERRQVMRRRRASAR